MVFTFDPTDDNAFLGRTVLPAWRIHELARSYILSPCIHRGEARRGGEGEDYNQCTGRNGRLRGTSSHVNTLWIVARFLLGSGCIDHCVLLFRSLLRGLPANTNSKTLKNQSTFLFLLFLRMQDNTTCMNLYVEEGTREPFGWQVNQALFLNVATVSCNFIAKKWSERELHLFR